MTVGSSYTFEVKGYDIDSNEIPLDGSQIIWEKSCGVGSLSNTSGLTTTYTAPTVTGERYNGKLWTTKNRGENHGY